MILIQLRTLMWKYLTCLHWWQTFRSLWEDKYFFSISTSCLEAVTCFEGLAQAQHKSMGLPGHRRNPNPGSVCHDVPLKVTVLNTWGQNQLILEPPEVMIKAVFEELCSLIDSIPISPSDSVWNPLELRIWGFAVKCRNMHKQNVQNGNQPNPTFFPWLQMVFSLNQLGLRATCWFVRRCPASIDTHES